MGSQDRMISSRSACRSGPAGSSARRTKAAAVSGASSWGCLVVPDVMRIVLTTPSGVADGAVPAGGRAQKTGRETSGDLADQLPRTCLLSEALLGQFPHIGHPNNVETIPENHPRGVAPGE